MEDPRKQLDSSVDSDFPLFRHGFLTVACGRGVESSENRFRGLLDKHFLLLWRFCSKPVLRMGLAFPGRRHSVSALMSTFPQALLLLLEFILFFL